MPSGSSSSVRLTRGNDLQVSIITPSPSIALLALYKWLQDTHTSLEADGSAFAQSQVLLVIKCWTTVPQPSIGQQGSDTSPRASSASPHSSDLNSPEASSSLQTPSLVSHEVASGAVTNAPASAATSPGPTGNTETGELNSEIAATSAAPRALTLQSGSTSPGAAAISPTQGPGAAPRQRRSSRGRQRQGASSLPAVAVKVFGPEYDNARNQQAVVSMVRGCNLPFRSATFATLCKFAG